MAGSDWFDGSRSPIVAARRKMATIDEPAKVDLAPRSHPQYNANVVTRTNIIGRPRKIVR